MSAYVCSTDHFKALAIFAASFHGTGYGQGRQGVDPRYVKGCDSLVGQSAHKLASGYADILYAENIRSVSARYPQATRDSLPGPIIKPLHVVVTAQDTCKAAYRLKPVQILKMCDGLEYQSCETDDYRQSVGFDLLDRIRGAAIRLLPGYEDAPWDYDASEKAA